MSPSSVRELDAEQCQKLLRSLDVGRVAFSLGGVIEIFPVNYVVDGTDIAFRTTGGTKLVPATQYDNVTFEVDDLDESSRHGSSVVVKGYAEAISDAAHLARLDASGLEPWADDTQRPIWVVVHARETTGRAVGHADA